MIDPYYSGEAENNPGCRCRWGVYCLLVGLFVGAVGVMTAPACAGMEAPTPMLLMTPTPDPTNVPAIPTGSPDYLAGMDLFGSNCAQCHGAKATGSDLGPPLIHEVYHPYHHPDFAFHAAVNRGVPRHHWYFGDMPSVPDLTDGQVDQIICYVRSLQRDSGMPVQLSC